MPAIEFVVPDPDRDGADEELAPAPRRSSPWGRRRGWALAAGLAALVAVGVTVRAASSTEHRDGAAPASAVRGTGPNAGSSAVSGPVPNAPPPPVIGCPSAASCPPTAAVPADLTRALRAVFPGLRDVHSSSRLITGVLPRPTLWNRRLTAVSGRLTIRLEMHAATDFDDPKSARVPAGPANPVSAVYARTLGRGLAVTVLVLGPAAQLPPITTVRSLAADRRLLAVA